MIALGSIIKWPGGYAMTLGHQPGGDAFRCCEGHDTPEQAKNHGIVRGIEVMQMKAHLDVAAWSDQKEAVK